MGMMFPRPMPLQKRQPQIDDAAEVAEGVGTSVAVVRRVGQGADPDPVEHDEDDSAAMSSPSHATSARGWASR